MIVANPRGTMATNIFCNSISVVCLSSFVDDLASRRRWVMDVFMGDSVLGVRPQITWLKPTCSRTPCHTSNDQQTDDWPTDRPME